MRLAMKVAMVLGMTLAILVPLALIRSVIHDRQMYRDQAVKSIAESYAGPQRVVGPVLVVPYTDTVEVEEKDAGGVSRKVLRNRERAWTYFPDTLNMAGTLLPATRRRGLHEVRVYELRGALDARFNVTIPADADPSLRRRIGTPVLRYGVGDVRGLVGSPHLKVSGTEVPLRQGIGRLGSGGGVHALLAVPAAGAHLQFDTRLEFALAGTETLALAPVGRRNRIVIDSTWRHPSFSGQFLPRPPRIDDKGFHAEWDVSSLASNAQAQYREGTSPDVAVISLVDPVNVYSLADRATKYGVLFVALTFVGSFMLEIIKQVRIHPIQYGFVGLAMALFFLLLVSLSEHIAFGAAYLAASIACVGLLGHYVAHVLHSRLRGIGFAAMLAVLYAALYGLLLSEDNALVLGAGLLFVILAAIMIATRKVDWYALSVAPR